jgi:simple sugar transport system ATP-binding protein
MMVGRSVELTVKRSPAHPGDPVLVVDELVVEDDREQEAVRVSFEVLSGEIVCVAGVQGNGQTELVEALTGLRSVASGRIELNGADLTGRSPNQILDAGVGHVPEDRQRDGLIVAFSIADNLVLDTFDRAPYARGVVRDFAAVHEAAVERASRFDVRTPSVDAAASTLSGGNQQKVVVARELSRRISLLIASQPTRGLDVGSIEYIHEQIVAERDRGTAVLIVSSELDEVLALGDRILVMFRGRIFGQVPGDRATREGLGLLMAGVTHEPAAADG